MKAPLKLQLTMTITDASGKVVSETAQTYHDCSNASVVAVEKAVIGGLLSLGEAGLAAAVKSSS